MRRVLGVLGVLTVLMVLAVLAIPRVAEAHPAPFSYVDLRFDRGASGWRLDGTIVVHAFDAAHDLDADPALSSILRRAPALRDMLGRRMDVDVDGRATPLQWGAVDAQAENDSIRLRMSAALPSAPGVVTVRALLFPYDPNHQTFLNVYENGELRWQGIVDVNHPSVDYVAGTTRGTFAIARRFIAAGIRHIWIGPDHLLFLAGLLLLGGSVRRLMMIVTAFTLAHSVTLSIAVLGLFAPPPRLVEPLIALSIVYVGADNLLVKDGRDVRAWIAFAFGLVHGFGFASVLRETGLPARALGRSLLSFNIGVELGQLAFVVVAASLFALLRSRSDVAARRLAFAGSVVVVVAGMFWFVQRV
jgi:HupE/UreJ protein